MYWFWDTGAEGIGLYALVLECVYDEGRKSMHSHPLATRRYAATSIINCQRTKEGTLTLIHIVMLTLLHPADAQGNATFRISHQEMIKGIRIGGTGKTLSYLDTLEIPIIENTPNEEDLTEGMARAMERYPDAGAVLVRRHGVYVWGGSWEQAKTQAECLDYLFEIAVSFRTGGRVSVRASADSFWVG